MNFTEYMNDFCLSYLFKASPVFISFLATYRKLIAFSTFGASEMLRQDQFFEIKFFNALIYVPIFSRKS